MLTGNVWPSLPSPWITCTSPQVRRLHPEQYISLLLANHGHDLGYDSCFHSDRNVARAESILEKQSAFMKLTRRVISRQQCAKNLI